MKTEVLWYVMLCRSSWLGGS